MIEVFVDTEGMEEYRCVLESAAQTALSEQGRGDCKAAILLTDDEAIRTLNYTYRQIDSATDVLSFPTNEGVRLLSDPAFIGDIAVSLDRAILQAVEYGHSIQRELAFLAIHGILHLLGFDHITAQDEEKMTACQRKILKADGYVDS